MTVIEALVVTLGLNDAEFQAKLEKSYKSLTSFASKEAAVEKKRDKESGEQKRKASEIERKQHLERERQIKAAAEGYKKISSAIVGMVGAMAGMAGVKALVTGSINSLVGVGRASKDLRMSARDVAAWGKTIEAVGGKSEDMIATMRGMNLAIANAAEGFNVDNPFVTFLNNQGIQWKDAAGQVRTMGELLPEMADAFNKFRPEQQAILAQQNGWNDDFVALLRKGSAEMLQIYSEKFEQTKADEDAIARAERLLRAWSDIRTRLQKVGMTIFEVLLPHLEKAVGYLERFSGWVDSNGGRIASFFSGVGDILSGVVDFLRDMHDKTDGWSTKILAAAAAFLTFKGVLGSILSMTGLPLLLKLLGGGAAGGAGLAALGKLGLVGAAGAAGWGIGSLISKRLEGTEAGDAIGRTIAKGLALFGHGGSREALNAEARVKGQALPYPELEAIQKTSKAQASTATSQLEEAKKGNKAATQLANEQSNWLKKIESGISKMNAAFEAGYNGLPQPAGGGAAGEVGYGAGKAAGLAKTAAGKAREAMLMAAARAAGITDPQELAHFMAQMAHESAGFRSLREYASGDAYEDRKSLGNTQVGDGRRFKGRGFVQLTGRANYTAFAKASGIDVVSNPELLEREDIAAQAAIWYWKNRVGSKWRRGIRAVTQAINGKENGLADRQAYFSQYSAMLQQAAPHSNAFSARSEVQINGGIHISTAATDANGIAQEIRPAVNRHLAGVTALGMS